MYVPYAISIVPLHRRPTSLGRGREADIAPAQQIDSVQHAAYSSVSGTKNPYMSYLRALWRILWLLKYLQTSRPNSNCQKLIRN